MICSQLQLVLLQSTLMMWAKNLLVLSLLIITHITIIFLTTTTNSFCFPSLAADYGLPTHNSQKSKVIVQYADPDCVVNSIHYRFADIEGNQSVNYVIWYWNDLHRLWTVRGVFNVQLWEEWAAVSSSNSTAAVGSISLQWTQVVVMLLMKRVALIEVLSPSPSLILIGNNEQVFIILQWFFYFGFFKILL